MPGSPPSPVDTGPVSFATSVGVVEPGASSRMRADVRSEMSALPSGRKARPQGTVRLVASTLGAVKSNAGSAARAAAGDRKSVV